MDKKTILAVVLSMAVILIYQMFLLPKPQPPVPREEMQKQVQPAPSLPEMPESPEAVAPPPQTAPGIADTELSEIAALKEEAEEKEIRVNNGLFEVVFSNRGGIIKSWKLLDYLDESGNPLEMTPEAQPSGLLPLAVMFKDENLTRSYSAGLHKTEGQDSTLGLHHPDESITFSRVDPLGVAVEKKISFHEHSYMTDIEVSVTNLGSETRDIPWWLYWGPGIGRDIAQRGRFYTGPLIYTAGKVSQDRPKKDGEQIMVPPGFKWMGLTDRYFLAAYIPSEKDGQSIIQRHDKVTYSFGMGPRPLFLPPGATVSIKGRFFVGPKSVDLLNSYDLGLENALDFGWFGWLGKPLLNILKFFNTYVRNWGVAIILLTLLVKFILFPITFNMYKSMRRMQEIQPQMMALKKKYKDDPQTLNREMMELYRSHKINPMGGCLPMVIQIPVFFALYKVLTIAIELRGAGFLHISDLSIGEPTLGQFLHGHFAAFPEAILPIKILVILMGATMFIQQRLSPTAGDPKQAKMMMFLPIIFTAMFWNFFSGLVVYFFFSNILAIGEQLLIRKLSAPAPAPAPAAKPKKKK